MQKRWGFATIAGLVLVTTPAAADPTVAQCVDSYENAQRAQKNGHLVFARKLFQECLVTACPKEVRNDCTEGQASVDRGIATVTFAVRDASGADVPSTIKVDGAPLAGEPGHAVPMDPGTHQIQYTVGGETKLTSVTILEGEKSRVVVLTANGAAPSSATSNPTTTIVQMEAPSRGYIVGPLVVGGVAVLTLLGATFMFVNASKESSARDEQRAVFNDFSKSETERNNAGRSANSHNDAANNDQLLGLVLVGSAVVIAGLAATWYFVAKPSGKKAANFSPVITF